MNTDRYGPKMDLIYTVYRRKYPVFTASSVRKRHRFDRPGLDPIKVIQTLPEVKTTDKCLFHFGFCLEFKTMFSNT